MPNQDGEHSGDSTTPNQSNVRESRPQVKGLKAPTPFSTEGNACLNWKLFKRRWMSYSVVMELDRQPEQYRVAVFLSCVTDDALRMYDGFQFQTPDEQRTVNEIIEQFEKFSLGDVNEPYERTIFNRRSQEEGETFDTYLATLRSMIKTCNFCVNCVDSLLRDKIVVGLRNEETCKELRKDRNLTLTKCIDICRAAEKAHDEGKVMRPETVNAIRGNKPMRSPMKKGVTLSGEPKCRYCGRNHIFKKEQCPAWQQTCAKCKKMNHFAAQCKTNTSEKREVGQKEGRAQKGKNRYKNEVHQVQDYHSGQSSDESSEIGWINTVRSVDPGDEVVCTLLVEGRKVPFQLDTGTKYSMLPYRYVSCTHNIQAERKKLEMWNHAEVTAIGTYRAKVMNLKTKEEYILKFILVKEDLRPLLGLQACETMGLVEVHRHRITQVASIRESGMYSKVIADKIGKLPGKVRLKNNPKVVPTVAPVRRIPVALRGKLRKELDRLLDAGIIAQVTAPTDWVNPIVIVPKGEQEVRICLDPSDLNKALQREHYTMPTLDDVLHEMSESTVFSKCDLRWGFLHVELEEESTYLTTFQTCFGRFRWLRLPFGLSVSPEIFQRKIHEALEGLEGVVDVADDIIVHGKGDTDHDRHFEKLIERCSEKGIQLNPKKLEHKASEITFLSHRLSKEGIRADSSKVTAIEEFPTPTNTTELRRFMGIVNFVGRYVPHLADLAAPLHNLMRNETPWNWSAATERAFQGIKKKISEQISLALFKPDEETTLECDASEYGLGAVIRQGDKPIAFASRALTNTEHNYAQIEKEMLATVFGLEKFHTYTYGRQLRVYTDHKPLVAITNKPLYKAPKRLQRMLLRAKQYTYELQYKKGRDLEVADALSRAPSKIRSYKEKEERVNWVQFIPVTPDYLPHLQQHTMKDMVLQKVQRHILEGWPETQKGLDPQVSQFFHHRDELAIANGVIMRGDRVVIPAAMRNEMKKKIHVGHQGINACLRRARELLFWPGMSAEIRQYVAACSTCLTVAPAQQSETLKMHEVAHGPWEKVGTDLFYYEGKSYLITVDYYSKFFEIDLLTDTLTRTVIGKMKAHFARYGIPQVVISDGGPQYTAEEFASFARRWGFKHVVSSPGNSQSNGMAEATVKRAKTLLKKAAKSREDPYLGLLAIRNTETEDMTSSPARRLMGRATRTDLPTRPTLLQFRPPEGERTQRELVEKQHKAAGASKAGATFASLRPFQNVLIRPIRGDKREWTPGTVTEQLSGRTYEVRTDSGRLLRRNRRFLKEDKSNTGCQGKQFGDEVATQVDVQTGGPNQRDDRGELPNGAEVEENQSCPMVETPKTTRSGRVVRPPQKLDL